MEVSRKDIMNTTDREQAFQLISNMTNWTNHRKAAERQCWKKKHEPGSIKKVPNRGKRYENKPTETTTSVKPPPSVENKPTKNIGSHNVDGGIQYCYICSKDAEDYDLPCGHPICHPCFEKISVEQKLFVECGICKKTFAFYDTLLEDDDEYTDDDTEEETYEDF